MANKPQLHSVFADDLYQYIDSKVASGYKEKSFYTPVQKFDKFCLANSVTEKVITRELADKILARQDNEHTTTHYSRVNSIKNILHYLTMQGYDIAIIHDIKYKLTDFKPHIYTDSEIARYFNAVDTLDSTNGKMLPVILPIFFRMLYCCGTRITETLMIKKQDIDLNEGIIKLNVTKNGCERYIVLSSELNDLFKRFADKFFYMLNDDDYIFSDRRGNRYSSDYIREIHQIILLKANIPFKGYPEGPRIHDWRHTMAVRSFKQMVDRGLDMYVALPILSAYLGHKTIFATERYVRLTMELFPYISEKFQEKADKIFCEVNYHEAD